MRKFVRKVNDLRIRPSLKWSALACPQNALSTHSRIISTCRHAECQVAPESQREPERAKESQKETERAYIAGWHKLQLYIWEAGNKTEAGLTSLACLNIVLLQNS